MGREATDDDDCQMKAAFRAMHCHVGVGYLDSFKCSINSNVLDSSRVAPQAPAWKKDIVTPEDNSDIR